MSEKEKFQLQLDKIEKAVKEKEKDLIKFSGEKQYLVKQLNDDSASLKKMGYTVTNKTQAQQLLDEKKPELENLVSSLSNKLNIENE